jgi:Ricin-type beta-trefoil lectin domain-like
MSGQVIPDGTYTVMGPGGLLAAVGDSIVLLGPEGDKTQQWEVRFDSGTYTLRNVATGVYLGNDGDPNEVAMMVKGASQPYTWQLSTGTDGDENTFVLTSAAGHRAAQPIRTYRGMDPDLCVSR